MRLPGASSTRTPGFVLTANPHRGAPHKMFRHAGHARQAMSMCRNIKDSLFNFALM